MSLSNNFPTIFPELNLDFANTGVLDPRITFTRASTATYYNQLGVLTSAAVDVPRFDYNPSTLAPLGLLIEESRTNLLLRSQEFGTSWIRFGTTTLTENTSVAPDGTTTGDNILFTSASAGIYQIVTGSASTTYTFSVWIKSSSSTQVKLVINTNLSDPTTQTITVTSGWQRFSIAKTTSVGTTSVTAQIQDNGSGNTQFDIWGAQLEVGAFATSYIPTTTTALTRSADLASMTGTNFSSWYNAAEGVIYSEWAATTNGLSSTGTNAFPFVYDIDSAAATTTGHVLLVSAGYGPGLLAATDVAGSGQASFSVATSLGNATVKKTAYGYQVNNFAFSLNGATALTDTSGNLPASPDRMAIGSQNITAGSNNFTGYIRRVAYYSVRLTNAQLQALTL